MDNNKIIKYSFGVVVGLALGLIFGIVSKQFALGVVSGLPVGVGLGFLLISLTKKK